MFDASTEDNVPKTPPNTSTTDLSTGKAPSAKNPIDLLLSELSGPMTPVTGGMSPVPSSANNDPTATTVQNAIDWNFPPTSAGKTTASSNNTNNTSVWPSTSTEPAQTSNEVPPHTEVLHQHNPSSMQYLPSASVAFSSTAQPTNSPVIDVASNNKPSVTPSEKDPSWSFTELPSQTTSKPTQETKSDVGLQPSKVETKASGRQEIPENLFTPSYLSRPAPLPNWQNVQPSGMGYGLQYYHNALPPSALSNSPMSINPFELTDVRNITHVSSLPSMASVPGAPQALSSPRTALMHTASLGSLVSQSPSYTSPVMGTYLVFHFL
ncbi:mucin-5AC-like [Vigna radiata var. radiata]|uniref:Mucin-5AC-like n=1 Tax=Vigna radiata var. radiata TaxID=3916 RepID=A0A3Q0F374_VIGRR|nr:mucin-5AC-like [Vigna radiata var. radiata]